MKRTAAQKVADDLTDRKIESSINGLLVELQNNPGNPDGIIKTYDDRIAKIFGAHAIATDFINRNFQE